MSDYFGNATLEDWLYEEVFKTELSLSSPEDIPKVVVIMFEKWRTDVKTNIESWMASDDGDGNPLSWRGWGRGFVVISDEEEEAFNELVKIATAYMLSTPGGNNRDS